MSADVLKVGQMQSGGRVEGIMLLVGSERRQDRNGNPYWQGELRGTDQLSIVARFFRPPETAFELPAGKPVGIRASVDTFRDQLNLKLEAIASVQDPAVADQFVVTSSRDREEMFGELDGYIDRIAESSPDIAAVCGVVLARNEVAAGIEQWPAASRRHHAYLGGLIEHVLEMLALATTLCQQYRELDRDLVYAGCILHDLGKLVELTPRGTEFAYSAPGSLVGHIAICDSWVASACAEVGTSPEVAMQLRHLVLSHHGERALGASVEPATAEAMALHLLDYLSSQLRQAVDATREIAAPNAVDDEGMGRRRDWRFGRFWYARPEASEEAP